VGQTTQNGGSFSMTGPINLQIVPLDLNHDGYSDLVIARESPELPKRSRESDFGCDGRWFRAYLAPAVSMHALQ
jgi:hypothetical protein